MFEWIGKNLATIITLLIVLALVGGSIAILVRNKKKGRTSCGCGCANCPMAGKCHQKTDS